MSNNTGDGVGNIILDVVKALYDGECGSKEELSFFRGVDVDYVWWPFVLCLGVAADVRVTAWPRCVVGLLNQRQEQ